MTDINQGAPSFTETGASGGPVGVAREQAAHVAETAQESSQHVVDTAKDEAANVAREVKYQLTELYEQAQDEVKDQAAVQQERVASRLRSVSEELGDMARSSQNSGMATELVREASTRSAAIASWLDERDPGDLLHEVRAFARRRPGTFIAAAAVAGALAGRLTRSIASGAGDTSPQSPQSRSPQSRPRQARIVPAASEEDIASESWNGDQGFTGTAGTEYR